MEIKRYKNTLDSIYIFSQQAQNARMSQQMQQQQQQQQQQHYAQMRNNMPPPPQIPPAMSQPAQVQRTDSSKL